MTSTVTTIVSAASEGGSVAVGGLVGTGAVETVDEATGDDAGPA